MSLSRMHDIDIRVGGTTQASCITVCIQAVLQLVNKPDDKHAAIALDAQGAWIPIRLNSSPSG